MWKKKYHVHLLKLSTTFIPVLAAPACFTRKYSEADIFTFSAHSSAQLYTEVSDASVQVTDSGVVLLFCFYH